MNSLHVFYFRETNRSAVVISSERLFLTKKVKQKVVVIMAKHSLRILLLITSRLWMYSTDSYEIILADFYMLCVFTSGYCFQNFNNHFEYKFELGRCIYCKKMFSIKKSYVELVLISTH